MSGVQFLLPRWLLSLALLCGMLLAPVAMAAACAPLPQADRAATHCAESGRQHRPAKQLCCTGVCWGVEVGIARFPIRLAAPLATIPIPTTSSLGGILLERATPPPRLA